MKQFGAVFRFEFLEYLKNRSFRAVTIIFGLVVIIGCALPGVLSMLGVGGGEGGSNAQTLAVSGIPEENRQLAQTAFGDGVQLEFVDLDADALKQAVIEGTYNAALVADGSSFTLLDEFSMYGSNMENRAEDGCSRYLQAQLLQASGMTDAQLQTTLSTTAQVQVLPVEGNVSPINYILGFAGLILLFVAVMMYGQMITMSVAGEKSTRTMEVLITYARPESLIFGKVLAAGAAGFAQLLLFVLLAAATLLVSGGSSVAFLQPLIAQSAWLFGYLLVFFLLGFLSFAFLFGAAGSLVSRVEDVNSASTPVTMISILVYLISVYSLQDPGGTVATVGSFVPFVSPLVMFLRICLTTVPVWEILVAIAINLATILAAGWVGTRIYRVGVLLYGSKVKFGSAIKLVFSKDN